MQKYAYLKEIFEVSRCQFLELGSVSNELPDCILPKAWHLSVPIIAGLEEASKPSHSVKNHSPKIKLIDQLGIFR